MTTTAAAQQTEEQTVPKLTIPAPPQPQEGDEELVTVTVGHMRNALYYYRLLPIVIDYAEDVSVIAVNQADETDKVLQALYEQEEQTHTWRKRALITAATTLAFFTTTVTMLIW